MPFEKIYSQRLRTFPPELRDSCIQYPELKKIIGSLVDELNDLGLSPETLRLVSGVGSGEEKSMGLPSDRHLGFSYPMKGTPDNIAVPLRGTGYSKILYEVISESGKFLPQLRVSTMTATLAKLASSPPTEQRNPSRINDSDVPPVSVSLPIVNSDTTDTETYDRDRTTIPHAAAAPVEKPTQEFVIPLVHDAEFFELLEGNIQRLATQMEKIHSEFLNSLLNLAAIVADTCRPASVAGNYHPYSSISTHPGMVDVKSKRMKSDLYAWREIFGVFVDSEVFEHTNDGNKIAWSIEESERRLNIFADKVSMRWLNEKRQKVHVKFPNGKEQGNPKAKKFKCSGSAEALQVFIKLNFLILDVEKAFQANIEAIKKLVKKHTEHTALPLSCSFFENTHVFSIGRLHQSTVSGLIHLIHPRLFIQEMSDKLSPLVPNQDDYSCAICTSLAFKPIRLSCLHFFCVRCLVKMQRRREDNCPMCRAPGVMEANEKNVDWGLLNFMEDWFPREAREKLKANEKEVVDEQLAEWRRDETHCEIM